MSDTVHAANLADWIGDYMKSDREYDLSYRGEPRIDANDIAFLENKYVPDLLIRVTDHTLKFNGGLSGTIKARRDMSYVATAKKQTGRPVIILISVTTTASRATSMRYGPRRLLCGRTLSLRRWERIRPIRIMGFMPMKLTALRPI